MISVVILTYNEEVNIAQAIQSVAWSDDVVVLDSHSTDRTVEIAEQLGARVHHRPFDNYAAQRNHAIREIAYQHDWLLMLDADEVVTDGLQHEMLGAVASAEDQTTMFRMRRKDYFLGRWLRRSSGYPTWFGRLFRPSRVEVRREINEEYHTTGNVEQLQEHLIHFPFSKGVSAWIEKHNRYSDMEAERFGAYREIGRLKHLVSPDPTIRRKCLKAIAYNLPFRPLLTFLYLYVLRGGFLDGRAGYYFAALRSSYELMIDAKRLERRNTRP